MLDMAREQAPKCFPGGRETEASPLTLPLGGIGFTLLFRNKAQT